MPASRAASAPFRETELYAPVKAFLEDLGYTVRGEVHHCDVAAWRPRPPSADAAAPAGAAAGDAVAEAPSDAAADDELVVVELKKGLTIDLLVQGAKRQREADLVYLAIPRPKKFWFTAKWRDQLHLLRRLELGLLLVDLAAPADSRAVEAVLDPQPFDRAKSRQSRAPRRAGLLREAKARSADRNRGGSTGVKLHTAYRERCVAIAAALASGGPAAPAALRTGPGDTKTAAILRANHYGWFERLKPGLYDLSESGRLAAAEAGNADPGLKKGTDPA